MKLARIGEIGKEKPVVIDEDGNYRDLSSIVKDFNPSTLSSVSYTHLTLPTKRIV